MPAKLTGASVREIQVSGDAGPGSTDVIHQNGTPYAGAKPNDLADGDDEEDARFADWHTGGPR